MNYTYIVLIPKKNEPMYMANFHPISLENVISRIVSKVMANRLKFILPNVYLIIKVPLCLEGKSLIIHL